MTSAERFIRQGVLPVFEDYVLEAEIARGGMGVVYRARQLSLDRVVAVKMIVGGQLATPESVERFRLEAAAAARLHHRGIVPIYEIGEFETQHYFSMELVDGASLAECKDAFQLKPGANAADHRQQEHCIAELIAAVGRALDFAHQRGVLHRDVKPSNILVDAEGQPRLTDFGLAKLIGHEGSNLTLTAAVLGTPGYLAPEQAAGRDDEITTAVDVYGLGATLYELLTGRPPFVGTTAVATMMMAVGQQVASPRQINPAVHRDLATIALKCLEKLPERRYLSAGAVADELARFVRGEPILARPVSPAAQLMRWSRRNPVLSGLAVVLTAVLLVGSIAVIWQWRRAEHANVALTDTVADLKWGAIDDDLRQGQTSRSLAAVAAILREHPDDANAAMFAMSVMEEYRFPVPAAPPIHHPGNAALSAARLSPDRTRIVTAGFDGTARLWDASTSLEVTPPLAHRDVVTWAEFSPDGSRVATCSKDKTVRLWDAATGHSVVSAIVLPEPVEIVQFSGDGKFLLARTERTVTIIDVTTGGISVGPIQHDGLVVDARFIGDGAHFFTAQDSGPTSCVRTWDTHTGKPIDRMGAPSIRYVALSPIARRVTVVTSDSAASVMDFPGGENRKELPNENGPFENALFSPSGDRLAMIGHNQWARVFDSSTGAHITGELPHYYLLNGISFYRADHALLTWADDALAQVWDVDTGRAYCEPMRHQHRVLYAEAAPATDSNDLFLTTFGHLQARTTDARNGGAQLWTASDHQNANTRVFRFIRRGWDGGALSHDGRFAALGTEVDRNGREEVLIVDVSTGKRARPSIFVKDGAWGLFFSRDDSRLMTTGSTGQVAIWTLADGKPATAPVDLKTSIRPAEMSTDGRMVVTGSTDGILRIWDTDTGRVIREMQHGGEIMSVAFSADSHFAASAGSNKIIHIWDVATGKSVRTLTGHQNEVLTIAFSPDGRQLLSGSLDFTARIWNTLTGEVTAVLPHRGDVLDVAFSPDGHSVATASRDCTAVLWDAETGLPRTRSLTHRYGVRNVRFTADGRRLVTVDFQGLRYWDVLTGHPLTTTYHNPMNGGTAFQCTSMRFALTRDQQQVIVTGDSENARIWQISIPPAGAPAWFPEFLETVAGQQVRAGSERPEAVAPERFLAIEEQLKASTETDYYTRWAQQWLTGSKPPTAGQGAISDLGGYQMGK